MTVLWRCSDACCRPQACSRKLYNCLKVAPYRPDQQAEEEEDDEDLMAEAQAKGIRVLGVAFSASRWHFFL